MVTSIEKKTLNKTNAEKRLSKKALPLEENRKEFKKEPQKEFKKEPQKKQIVTIEAPLPVDSNNDPEILEKTLFIGNVPIDCINKVIMMYISIFFYF